jgi:hypothetical protein
MPTPLQLNDDEMNVLLSGCGRSFCRKSPPSLRRSDRPARSARAREQDRTRGSAALFRPAETGRDRARAASGDWLTKLSHLLLSTIG